MSDLQSLALSFFSRLLKCFLSCLNPCGLPLVAWKASSEAVCLLPSTHISPPTCKLLCDNKKKNAVGMMFVHANSPHRTERLEGPRRSSSEISAVSKFPHCTLSWMISYLLLLNEHKEILESGLECPWHKYSILLPHTPVFPHLFFSLQQSEKPTVLLTLHLVFTHTRKKKTHTHNTLNMMPAEPGALIKYMRTQICTFCQSGGGFPTENKGLGFPKLEKKTTTSF